MRNGEYGFYFSRCMNIIINSLLTQLVKYDVHTTCKMKLIHLFLSHIIILMKPNSLSGPHDNDDIFKVMVSKVKVADNIFQNALLQWKRTG